MKDRVYYLGQQLRYSMVVIVLAGAIAIMCQACSGSVEEKAIADFAQTVGETKTEMKFKSKSIETVKEIKAQDSIDIYLKEIKGFESGKQMLDTLEKRLIEREKIYAENPNPRRHMKEFIDNMKASQPSIELAVKNLRDYVPNPEMTIGKHLKCTYTIENPFLNSAEQEITATFFYSTRSGKVYTRLP